MLPAESNSSFLYNLNSRVLDTNHSDLRNATSHFYQTFLVRAGLDQITLKHVTSLSRQLHLTQGLTARFYEIQTAEQLGRVASRSSTTSAGTNCLRKFCQCDWHSECDFIPSRKQCITYRLVSCFRACKAIWIQASNSR